MESIFHFVWLPTILIDSGSNATVDSAGATGRTLGKQLVKLRHGGVGVNGYLVPSIPDCITENEIRLVTWSTFPNAVRGNLGETRAS